MLTTQDYILLLNFLNCTDIRGNEASAMVQLVSKLQEAAQASQASAAQARVAPPRFETSHETKLSWLFSSPPSFRGSASDGVPPTPSLALRRRRPGRHARTHAAGRDFRRLPAMALPNPSRKPAWQNTGFDGCGSTAMESEGRLPHAGWPRSCVTSPERKSKKVAEHQVKLRCWRRGYPRRRCSALS